MRGRARARARVGSSSRAFRPTPTRASRRDLLAGEVLVHLADLERRERLEEARAVVRAGRVGVLEHRLRELAVELGARVGEVALDVDELLEVVEFAVHLNDRHVLAEELIRAVRE